MSRAALQLAAVRAVVNDKAALAALSPPSRILLATVQAGLEEAIGKSLAGITDEMMSGGVGESTSSAVASTVADVASEVPVVGTVLGWIVKFFASLFGGGDGGSAEYCNRFLGAFKPVATGSMLGGGVTVPADVFAAVHAIPAGDYWGDAAPGNTFVLGAQRYASALGSALMAITEGVPADYSDIPAPVQPFFTSAVKAVIKRTDQQYIEHSVSKRAGVRSSWRPIFRALRRAMAAEHGPELPAGAASDGGLALWPVYLDLLVAEAAPELAKGDLFGAFPIDYLVWTIRARGAAYLSEDVSIMNPHGNGRPFRLGMFGDEDTYHPVGDPDRGCSSILADQIRSLIDGWKNAVHPYYEGGQAKLAELEAQAKVIATDSILRAKARGGLVLPAQQHGNVAAGLSALAALGVVAGIGWWALSFPRPTTR